jgi:hypothetical protein
MGFAVTDGAEADQEGRVVGPAFADGDHVVHLDSFGRAAATASVAVALQDLGVDLLGAGFMPSSARG